MSVCLSVTPWPCACLSVCFNTICHCRLCSSVSVWPSICSIRQSIPFVFDSWCVILSVCLSDVIQVQCARAESPGVTSLFFLSLDTFQSGSSGDACTCACKKKKKHSLSINTGMHLVKGCRYLMLCCRSNCTAWPVALLWSNCEVF